MRLGLQNAQILHSGAREMKSITDKELVRKALSSFVAAMSATTNTTAA